MDEVTIEIINYAVRLCKLSDLRVIVIERNDLFLSGFLHIPGKKLAAIFDHQLSIGNAGLLIIKAALDYRLTYSEAGR